MTENIHTAIQRHLLGLKTGANPSKKGKSTMRLLLLIGSLLLSVTQVMVSLEPIKAEITEDALDEYCWSNMQLCEASVRRRSIISQIWYEFGQYCGAKSNGWLTPKGISEGAEHLYRHNEPRDDWDGKLLAKEHEDHIIYHALFDVYEAHRDCLDWDRFANRNLLRN